MMTSNQNLKDPGHPTLLERISNQPSAPTTDHVPILLRRMNSHEKSPTPPLINRINVETPSLSLRISSPPTGMRNVPKLKRSLSYSELSTDKTYPISKKVKLSTNIQSKSRPLSPLRRRQEKDQPISTPTLLQRMYNHSPARPISFIPLTNRLSDPNHGETFDQSTSENTNLPTVETTLTTRALTPTNHPNALNS